MVIEFCALPLLLVLWLLLTKINSRTEVEMALK